MPMHQDWRGKIHDTLRASRGKLAGDYIQRNLDYFNTLLPSLRLGREVVMHRRDIAALTDGAWSEASIGKFLKYMDKAGAIEVRNAGSRGLGITLSHDLTVSPWRSRRSNSKPQKRPDPEMEHDMTPPAQHTDEDYGTSLDLDLTLRALDKVSTGLLQIDLSFAKDFSGDPAAKLYEAQERITRAVRQLSQIRAAVGAGDDSDLEEIVSG